MCLAPSTTATGNVFGCRKCWQCRQRKIDDWVGRCIAETKTAQATHSVTLTYGRDEEGNIDHHKAAVLTYSDVQKFIKRLRKLGHVLRYFAVGEYGSMKGRAHWHILIFWGNTPPAEIILDKRFSFSAWPEGYAFFEKPNAASIRYVCKYIQKDFDDSDWQGHLAMSKKPPLGTHYFLQLAKKHVEQGLAPRDTFYSFPEVKRRGEPVKFLLGGSVKFLYLQEFLRYWKELHGEKHPPNSDLIDEYLDKITPERLDLSPAPRSGTMTKPHSSQLRRFMKPEDIKFNEKLNLYYYDNFVGGGDPWYWAIGKKGIFEWQGGKKIGA